MTMKTISIDFDDVLLPFSQGFVEYHNLTHLTSVRYEDWYTWEMHEVFSCDPATMATRVNDYLLSPHHEILLPLPGVVEAITTLKSEYNLEVVTSRIDHTRDKVMFWIDKFLPETFQQVHFTNSALGGMGRVPRKKSEVCKEIGAILHIDDALGHAADISLAGIPVLLPDRPWNQGEIPNGVTRVSDWNEILDWIKKNVA